MDYKKRGASAADEAAMAWQNFLIPIVGAAFVSTLSFVLGKLGYSFLWIIILCALSIGKSYLWRKRERRLMSLRTTSTREREAIMAQLQDLPAWVQFPDTERVEWLNKVIHQLWPYVAEYSQTFMTDVVLPQVRAQMPAMLKNFKFTKMDMGDIPCRVGGIKVYTTNVGRDRIIVDMDVAYAGDADFAVSCNGFSGGMNQIQFTGKLRAVLKPLLPFPPMIGGIAGSFLEMPTIDFNLTGMGEFVELPGLMNAIRSIMNSQIAAMCVLPNEIVVPLAPDVDVTKLFFPEPDGVVRLKIVEAKNLENRDISFIRKGKSDPYCEIQVGSQFFKTRTIDNDLNPVFNEYFEAVVDQAHGQKLRIELFDEDQGQDEELGRLSVELSNIRTKGTIDKWYPLEGCKHGDLHIKATWLNLSKDLISLEKQEWESEWLKADKPIHPALLMIFVDSVSDLPYPKSKLEPSPFVEVTLGKDNQRTPVKVKTVNPLFQTKFMFFVRHPDGQELKIEAIDDGTRRSLGTFTLPLSHLMKEPQLEYNQLTFPLTLGVHQSQMVLTVRLRGLCPGATQPIQPSELDHHTLSQYTGNYIERGNSREANGTGADAQAVEPSKTVDHSGGPLTINTELNTSNFHLNSPGSPGSVSGRSQSNSRLGRLFRSKHLIDREIPSNVKRGELEMAIRYADATQKLVVLVLKARNLLPIDKKSKSADPYVTVKLIAIDTGKQVEKKKTGTVVDTLQPDFDNHFEFDVKSSDVLNYRLLLEVKDATNYGLTAKIPILGTVDMRLDRLHDKELPQQWIELEAPRK